MGKGFDKLCGEKWRKWGEKKRKKRMGGPPPKKMGDQKNKMRYEKRWKKEKRVGVCRLGVWLREKKNGREEMDRLEIGVGSVELQGGSEWEKKK